MKFPSRNLTNLGQVQVEYKLCIRVFTEEFKAELLALTIDNIDMYSRRRLTRWAQAIRELEKAGFCDLS